MNRDDFNRLADELFAGRLPVAEFLGTVAQPLSAELDDTTLDLDRQRRCGFPEAVFGEGKSVESLERIFHRLLAEGVPVIATRISAEKAAALGPRFPQSRYNPIGRVFRVESGHGSAERRGRVAVVTAGTSDLPVAEEARETLDWMGVEVRMIHDVGVAGPHRIWSHVGTLRAMHAVVVVAGMEGALPSVVGGHVGCPVIAVPTSVGYGASFGGVAALLSMLNCCASNVTVVNIDAGFKAAYVAGLVARSAGE